MGNNIVEHTLNKVVFLDRDGTLNEEVNYLHKPEDMKLLPGVPQALKKLKDAGYNTTRLRKEKLLNESAIQYLRDGKPVGAKALNNICMLLDMQPGNIIKYVEEENTK